ncbi:hypothetical protein Q9251_08145 [Alkalihalobacillus macyae]|nr:hypothetical protein [Alkalihalobacillus macyae]MDP4550853.1 hypothetical protein [Alkalihalobacillus macyae]
MKVQKCLDFLKLPEAGYHQTYIIQCACNGLVLGLFDPACEVNESD